MSNYVWSYIINTFLVATKHSYRLALRIAKDHDAALFAGKDNPDINALYVVFHPLYLALDASYVTWIQQGGEQGGEGLSLSLLLQQLSKTKIADWDIAIQVEYKNYTPEYKKILPHRRGPFQTGRQDDKVTAVSALSKSLEGKEKLVTVKQDVDGFLVILKAAQTLQSTAGKTLGTLSENVEKSRVAMCAKMFGNYGRLLGQHEANPAEIVKYFPIKYIRSSQQVFFSHIVKPGAKYQVVKHTFKEGDELTVTLHTDASVKVFLGGTKDDNGDNKGVILTGNTTTTVPASDLGDIVTCPFLIVINQDATISADIEIEFL